MKTIKIICSLTVIFATIALSAYAGVISIIQPQAGSILTNGSRFTIKWTPAVGVSTVRIAICPDQYHCAFIDQSAPNTGEYSWVVDRQSYDPKYYTNNTFEIRIDGNDDRYYVWIGSSGYFKIVDAPIIKPQPVQVPIAIRRVVSVEWIADTNHVYQVQSSTDLKTWDVVTEGRPPDTNAMVLFYAEQQAQYFRVYDTTP